MFMYVPAKHSHKLLKLCNCLNGSSLSRKIAILAPVYKLKPSLSHIYIIGASLSEPHTIGSLVQKFLFTCLFACLLACIRRTLRAN